MRYGVGDDDTRFLSRSQPAAAAARTGFGLLQRQVGLEDQCVGATKHRGQIRSAEGQLRDRVAIVVARRELEVHLDLAGLAADQPDQLVIRVDHGRVIRRRTLADREEVGDGNRSLVSFEARLQDVGAGEVATAGPIGLRRGDPAVAAAVPIKQPGEDGAGVEAMKAAPVDGAVAGDQCGRVAVADQGVITDRRVAFRLRTQFAFGHRSTMARAASRREAATTSGLGYTSR